MEVDGARVPGKCAGNSMHLYILLFPGGSNFSQPAASILGWSSDVPWGGVGWGGVGWWVMLGMGSESESELVLWLVPSLGAGHYLSKVQCSAILTSHAPIDSVHAVIVEEVCAGCLWG